MVQELERGQMRHVSGERQPNLSRPEATSLWQHVYNLPFPRTSLSSSVVNLVFTLTNRPRSLAFLDMNDHVTFILYEYCVKLLKSELSL